MSKFNLFGTRRVLFSLYLSCTVDFDLFYSSVIVFKVRIKYKLLRLFFLTNLYA